MLSFNIIDIEKVFFMSMIFLFIVWFLLSVLNQFRFKFMYKVLAFDYFHLLPFWTFFAPEPGISDHELMYRDRAIDKTITPWKKVVFAQRSNSFLWFIDNNKYKSKIISDHQSHIIEMVKNDFNQNQLKLTFSYLSLLSYVMLFSKNNNAEQRQFIIVDKQKSDDKINFHIILASEWHKF